MSLPTWLAAGWLQRHRTSPEEIRDLWKIVERDLRDAASGTISADWRYGIAYNAALKVCTILLAAEGYRPAKGQLAHTRTVNALPHILGAAHRSDADYLDGCRQKRNIIEYDRTGDASETDTAELIAYVRELQAQVLTWLKDNHPELTPPR